MRLSAFGLICSLCISFPVAASIIQLQGFVPPDIEATDLEWHYKEMYARLAPHRKPDRTPLRIMYDISSAPSVGGYSLPEWGGGGAIGKDLIVVLLQKDPFLKQNTFQISVHELVHSVLLRAYPRVSIPRWVHEGLAMTLAGEVSFDEQVAISKAIFANTLETLTALEEVNSFSRQRAFLAYAQSHHAIRLLIERFGIEGVVEILVAAQKEGDFWLGMSKVLSITEQEFEQIARKDLITRYRFVFMVADTYLLWIGLSLLFLIGLVASIIRNRAKARALADAEASDSALTASTDAPENETL